MAYFRGGGRMNAATAATANHVAAQFWNPHSTARPRIWEIHIAITTAAVANISLQRSTARGATPGATVTPDIDSSDSRDFAPPSGSVIELAAFGTQPTLDTTGLWRWNLPATVGSGVIIPLSEGLAVPPGTGLAICTPVAVVFPISDISFVWEE